MSIVPLMFRDWWSDFDVPFRTSNLLDQRFGTGVRRDDLLNSFWNPTPAILRRGYIRPWENRDMQHDKSRSIINLDNDKFQVIMDVQQFSPNELTVKTIDNFIVVEGKHEEQPDEHGYIARHFVRRYAIPEDVNQSAVKSNLSSDGILTVTAPLKNRLPSSNERVIPIVQSGQPKAVESKADKK